MLFNSQRCPHLLALDDASAEYMFTTQEVMLRQSCLTCSSESVARSLMFCLTFQYAHLCLNSFHGSFRSQQPGCPRDAFRHLRFHIRSCPLVCEREGDQVWGADLAARDTTRKGVANHGVGAALEGQCLQQAVHSALLLGQGLCQWALQLRRVQQHLPHRQLCQQRVKLLHISCTPATPPQNVKSESALQHATSARQVGSHGASSSPGTLPASTWALPCTAASHTPSALPTVYYSAPHTLQPQFKVKTDSQPCSSLLFVKVRYLVGLQHPFWCTTDAGHAASAQRLHSYSAGHGAKSRH